MWMAAAFASAAALSALVLTVFGAGERGTVIALQLTARLSFLLFWLAYAGGGLAALFGPVFQPLKRHGRDLGLAFAAAHLVHVALVAWLCWIGATPASGVFLFFGPPLALVYLLALASIGRLQRMIGRSFWWLLRTVAMTWIAYAFAVDFLHGARGSDAKHIIGYLPFAVLSVAGPLLYFLPLLPPPGRLWKASS